TRSVAVAHLVDKTSRLRISEPAVVFNLNRCEHQRQRRETFSDVVADGLAYLTFGCGEVEDVVCTLNGKTELSSTRGKGSSLLPIESSKQRPDLAAPGHGQRGFGLDAAHVLLDVSAVAEANGLLAHLAGADAHDGAREDVDHLRHAGARRMLVSLGEVVIADHDGRFVAEAR